MPIKMSALLFALAAVGALVRPAMSDSPPPDMMPKFTPPPVGAPTLGTPPAVPPAGSTTNDAGLAATTRKFNAYVEFMNRTLRSMDSIERYKSWVNVTKGPTGHERVIYGLYSTYDTGSERTAALAALTAAPLLPDLDEAMRVYIAANDKLAPILNEASGYYDRADYKLDHMAEGKALHARIVAAAGPFVASRARLEAVMRVEKSQVDAIRLATIEKHEGRSARWHVANVMIRARTVMDLVGSGTTSVDMNAFGAAMGTFGSAVKDMDGFATEHPRAFFVFKSEPDRLLAQLRELGERLGRAKGDLRRAAGMQFTFLVNDYNLMVSTSQTATSFGDQ